MTQASLDVPPVGPEDEAMGSPTQRGSSGVDDSARARGLPGQIVDFSPPSSPSPDEQGDALRKGLGRAPRWAMAGRLDEAPLLEACLRDLRFDSQVEGPRGDWLWRMVRAVDAADRFRVPILHAVHDLSDERNAEQLCELARRYAEAGDDTFRKRLYEIVARKPVADRTWLGEEEIMRLDGESAFLFAARVRGEGLADRDWECDDGGLMNRAIERFGEARAAALLEITRDAAIRAFRGRWRAEQRANAERGNMLPHRERMRALTVADVLAEAESRQARFGRLRGWGMYADESDLGIISEHLRAAREPGVIANLLGVFSNRAASGLDTRLIELCRHGDASVRRRAMRALENVEHPSIRDHALAELASGMRGEAVVGLFIKNYRPGDEQRIVGSLRLPEDEFELHGILIDVVKVLEANPAADCSQLGVIAYASTPCENCRADAARLLYGQHVAPQWLCLECPLDSSEECRGLAAEATDPTPDQPVSP